MMRSHVKPLAVRNVGALTLSRFGRVPTAFAALSVAAEPSAPRTDDPFGCNERCLWLVDLAR
jgi:hypothetical protein